MILDDFKNAPQPFQFFTNITFARKEFPEEDNMLCFLFQI